MSDHNPYEKLGVSEDASFDEIQDVRNHLLEQHNGDSKRLEVIEAAYDTILMDRLRMRQEGKIKVPERIRFPERLLQAPPKEISSAKHSPAWLQQMLDRPATVEIVLPGVWYLGLSAISLFYPTGGDQILQLVLITGIGIGVYFLNRKEGRLIRAVLLTLAGLIVGLISGALLASLVMPQLELLRLSANQFSTVVTFVLLWLIASFLK